MIKKVINGKKYVCPSHRGVILNKAQEIGKRGRLSPVRGSYSIDVKNPDGEIKVCPPHGGVILRSYCNHW